ncbi:MAG: hypothetical protein FWD37_01605 [Methanomassiliicoccaceae archaeon]|nr:hypothetical protein [Methanomassiliicoccaceae archaeon]
MIASKIIVMAVAALCVGGAAAAVVFWPDGGSGEWDPMIGEVDYSLISTTPRIVEVMESMYEQVYGDLPAKKTAPSNYLKFNSLVETVSGGIRIKSSTGTGGYVNFASGDLSNMKIISYGRGFTDTYAKMLGNNVWNTVKAAGSSTWTNYPTNGMTSANLGSEMSFAYENLAGFLSGDKTTPYCVIVWGYSNTDPIKKLQTDLAGDGYSNVKVLTIDYYSMTSWEYFLSVIDALGQLINVKTASNTALTDFKNRLYTIENAVAEKVGKKVYLETSSNTSPGPNTLTQLCFDSLGLTNINTISGTNNLNDEVIVSSRPDVIFYVKGDTTVDARMERLGL